MGTLAIRAARRVFVRSVESVTTPRTDELRRSTIFLRMAKFMTFETSPWVRDVRPNRVDGEADLHPGRREWYTKSEKKTRVGHSGSLLMSCLLYTSDAAD